MESKPSHFSQRKSGGAAGRWLARWLTVGLALVLLGSARVIAVERTELELERRFAVTVRPFVESYCLDCHGGEKPKADFDLRACI